MFTYYDENAVENAFAIKEIATYKVMPKSGEMIDGHFVMDHISVQLINNAYFEIPYDDYYDDFKSMIIKYYGLVNTVAV